MNPLFARQVLVELMATKLIAANLMRKVLTSIMRMLSTSAARALLMSIALVHVT